MAAPPPPPPAALGTPISIGAGGEVRALAAAAPTGPQAALYPLSNYSFGPGAQGADKDAGLEDRLRRMKNNYDREGARRTVDAVLLCARHNIAHVLLLRDGAGTFRLPGGKLKPGETELDGLRRKLASKLNPPPESPIAGPAWSVNGSTKLGTWWRPNFESPLFPFKPAHVTEPKESRSVYLVSMPEEAFLAPATNFKLVAVPLHELYDNAGRYGPVLAAVPTMLASVQLNIVSTGKAEGE